MRPSIPRGNAFPESVVATSELRSSPTRFTPRGRPQVQAQTISQQQVVQRKTKSGHIPDSISFTSNSERCQLIQKDKLKVWEVGLLPQTESKFFINKGKNKTVILVHGAGGNHAITNHDLKELKKYAKSKSATILLVNDIVRSHLAPKRLRENCNITTDIGTVMLTPSEWNKAEENLDPSVRDLTYRPEFQNVSFQEVLQDKHNQTRDAIVKKLDEQANLSGEKLVIFEQNIAGHDALSLLSVRQLCRDHESLGVKSAEGIYMYYGRGVVSKMTALYDGSSSPVQEAWLHTGGNGKQQVKPGVILEDCREQLDEHFAMGLAICESIPSSPLAQAMLQLDLGHAHKKGYDAIQHASERYAYLEDKQKQGGITNLPSFNSQPPTSNFEKPGTPQYRDNLEQKRLAGLKQTRLDTDEALEKSVAQKIGDYNTPTKDEILKVGGRPEAEKFINNFKESP
jgi:hypothetical protein